MELHKKIDTITQAFDDYLPEFWRSDNYRTDMAMTILDKDNRKWKFIEVLRQYLAF